jgi:hypothetical protein
MLTFAPAAIYWPVYAKAAIGALKRTVYITAGTNIRRVLGITTLFKLE